MMIQHTNNMKMENCLRLSDSQRKKLIEKYRPKNIEECADLMVLLGLEGVRRCICYKLSKVIDP